MCWTLPLTVCRKGFADNCILFLFTQFPIFFGIGVLKLRGKCRLLLAVSHFNQVSLTHTMVSFTCQYFETWSNFRFTWQHLILHIWNVWFLMLLWWSAVGQSYSILQEEFPISCHCGSLFPVLWPSAITSPFRDSLQKDCIKQTENVYPSHLQPRSNKERAAGFICPPHNPSSFPFMQKTLQMPRPLYLSYLFYHKTV